MKLFLLLLLLVRREAGGSYSHRPMDLMADLTNDLGVCILQIQSSIQYGNIAFSPYGVASMSVLLYEGATGNTALEIMRVMNLPWNTILTRIGFRDINRHLRTYFNSDGFLRGLIMSRDDVCFNPSYQKILRLYGFEEPDKALTYPCNAFVPYSPSTMPFPLTTVAVGNETTTVSSASTTASTDKIATELTQTSQTVTVVSNSTTYIPINAQTLNGAQTNLEQTESTFIAQRPITTTMLDEDETSSSALDDIVYSSTSTNDQLLATSTMEIAESTIKVQNISQKETSTLPAGATVANKTIVRTAATAPRPNDTVAEFQNSTTDKFATTTEYDKTVVSQSNYSSQPNEIYLEGDLELKNFTNKLKQNFGTTLSNFGNGTRSSFGSKGESLFGRNSSLNTSFTLDGNLVLPNISFTGPSFPIFDEGVYLKNSTSFYNTLVNFIENTTQKLKEIFDSDETISTTESIVKYDSKTNTSASKKGNDNAVTSISKTDSTTKYGSKIANTTNFSKSTTNSNTIGNKISSKNGSSANKIASSIKKNTTATTTNNSTGPSLILEGKTNETHVLPKKSISANNEKSNAAAAAAVAINMTPDTANKQSKYYNVVSVRQSKSISSKYDIKGVRTHKRYVKRHAILNSDFADSKNATHSTKDETNKASQNLTLTNLTGSGFSIFERRVQFAVPSMDVKHESSQPIDNRKVRSYGHNYFLPYGMDWFTTYGNSIKVPVFTYSAILPFAYIEQLKSKVLEIPLDDRNYSLLLLLPSEGYGLDYTVKSLRHWPLRAVYNHLHATAVYARIPKFSVISHINLRPSMYALGMKDVFHRYLADLSIMSPDARLFVRSIEQVVTIRVDKFPNTAYSVPETLTDRHFVVSQPFLYFVIDKESQVTLVAGIMMDPTKQNIRFL